jgi:hypothetical protein
VLAVVFGLMCVVFLFGVWMQLRGPGDASATRAWGERRYDAAIRNAVGLEILKSTSQPLQWRTDDPVNKRGAHTHRHEKYAGCLPAERSAYCQCFVDDARRSLVPSEISWRQALRLNSNSRGIGSD